VYSGHVYFPSLIVRRKITSTVSAVTVLYNGMCKVLQEDHLLQLLTSLKLKNVAENIGLFRPPRARDMYVWSEA